MQLLNVELIESDIIIHNIYLDTNLLFTLTFQMNRTYITTY